MAISFVQGRTRVVDFTMGKTEMAIATVVVLLTAISCAQSAEEAVTWNPGGSFLTTWKVDGEGTQDEVARSETWNSQVPSSSTPDGKSMVSLCHKMLESRSGRLLGALVRTLFSSPPQDPPENSSEMRGKHHKSGKMTSAVTAAVVSGGAMMMMTLAVLAAMAGKAMLASVLAIVLSGVSLWQAGVGLADPAQNTVEIVARPVMRQPSYGPQADYYFEQPHP